MKNGERPNLKTSPATAVAYTPYGGKPSGVQPLENGDHLTRDEFERRYDVTPGLKKAELLEGTVYVSPPVRFGPHGVPHADLMGWLSEYRTATQGVRLADNTTVRFDTENELQPDALLLIDPARGGQASIDEAQYVAGPPELVAEVSSSSASIDLHAKFEIYRRNGVREYVVWRVLDAAVDWFVLRQEKYERLLHSVSGIYQSEVFPGLWLDAAALLRGDVTRVQEVLRQGLASPEHAAFVGRLQQPPSKPNV